ncbi:unnamed protein product [Paramecium primaurelia]|uniref:Uncharacterized protein n=1 Tax=Paramecium primaurelia TaxID=5886 RepID=A0A8S1PCY6_PARPR|nr:unnamed protein product [Paramecium primaurelia]
MDKSFGCKQKIEKIEIKFMVVQALQKSQRIQIKQEIQNGLENMVKITKKLACGQLFGMEKNNMEQVDFTQTMDQSRVFGKNQDIIILTMLQFMKLENMSIIKKGEYGNLFQKIISLVVESIMIKEKRMVNGLN